MALTDNKITTWTNPIVNEADRPQRSAADMKAIFDSNSNQLKTALNNLIDALAASGAGEIGAKVEGMSGTDVLSLLVEMKELIDALDEYAETLKSSDGAANIGAAVAGVTGDNIAAVLTALKTLCDRMVTTGEGDVFLANDGTYKLPRVGAAANGVAAGGAAGSLYVKKSTKVYDAEWKTVNDLLGNVFAGKNHNHNDVYQPKGDYQPAGSYAAPSQAKTVTLAIADWDGAEAPFTQTVTVQGMTANANMIACPAPASLDAYGSAQVRCTAQAENSLTFVCHSVPEEALNVNVLIVG